MHKETLRAYRSFKLKQPVVWMNPVLAPDRPLPAIWQHGTDLSAPFPGSQAMLHAPPQAGQRLYYMQRGSERTKQPLFRPRVAGKPGVGRLQNCPHQRITRADTEQRKEQEHGPPKDPECRE